MNKEECIELFKQKVKKYDESVEIKGVSVGEEMRILDTVLDYIADLEKENAVKESHIKIVSAYNEELRKELKDYRELTDKYEEEHRTTFKEWCNSLNNSIPKQKIRNKIEELKDKEQELSDEQGYWGGQDLLVQIEILEELLGE